MATKSIDFRKSQIETLQAQKNRILARIAELERKDNADARKRDTRLKVLVGAACLADAARRDDTRDLVRKILERGIVAPRDREFLKVAGWL